MREYVERAGKDLFSRTIFALPPPSNGSALLGIAVIHLSLTDVSSGEYVLLTSMLKIIPDQSRWRLPRLYLEWTSACLHSYLTDIPSALFE